MKDMLMVPASAFSNMRERFKRQATTNTVLENMADLGATEQVILQSNLPASMAIQLVEPLERRRRAQTKRLRTGGEVGTSYGANADEPEPLVNTPSEALVKRLMAPLQKRARQGPHTRTPRRQIPHTPSRIPVPSTSGLTAKQRARLLQTPPNVKEYYSKGKKSTPQGYKAAAIKGAKAAALESLGLQSLFDSDEEETPKGRRYPIRKRQQQPHGWETYLEDKKGKRPKKKGN